MLVRSVAVAYLIRRYNRLFRIKEEELFKCQNNMNLLYESMRDREENAKHGNIKDETLEVYSKSFIWTLMRDLQEKELDVAIAIIGASYCVENNRSNWKEYLYYIKTNIPDDYIFGVFDDGHMVLFGVDVDFQGFSIKVTTILNRANNMFQEYAWKSSYVFGERKQDGESLEEVIQEAIKEFDQMK